MPSKKTPSLGQKLREVRGRLSLREMERRSGLNSGYLSQLEHGRIAHPSPGVLRSVSDAYGIRYADVLRWAGYGADDASDLPPRQARALGVVAELGDPSEEELETLTAIVNLIQQRRRS